MQSQTWSVGEHTMITIKAFAWPQAFLGLEAIWPNKQEINNSNDHFGADTEVKKADKVNQIQIPDGKIPFPFRPHKSSAYFQKGHFLSLLYLAMSVSLKKMLMCLFGSHYITEEDKEYFLKLSTHSHYLCVHYVCSRERLYVQYLPLCVGLYTSRTLCPTVSLNGDHFSPLPACSSSHTHSHPILYHVWYK